MDLLSFIRQLLPPHHRKPVIVALLRWLFGPAERLFRDVESLLNRFVGLAQANGQMKSLEYALNVAAGFPSGDGPIYLLNGNGRFDFQVVIPTGVPADIMSALVVTLERYRLKSKRYRIVTEDGVAWGDNPGENPDTTTLRFQSGYPSYDEVSEQIQIAVEPPGTYYVRIYKDGVDQIPPGDITFGSSTVFTWPGAGNVVQPGLYRVLVFTPGVMSADRTISAGGRACDLAWDDDSTATTKPALQLVYLTNAFGGGGIYRVEGRVKSAYANIFPLSIEVRQGTGTPVLKGLVDAKDFSFETTFLDGTYQMRVTDKAGCKTLWKTFTALVPGACDLSFAVTPSVERVNNQYRVSAQVSSARSNLTPYTITLKRGTTEIASASTSTNPMVLLLPVGTASGAVTLTVVDAHGCQAQAGLTLPDVTATTAGLRVGYRRDGNTRSLEVLAKVPDAGAYVVAITPLSGQLGTNLTNARPMVVENNSRYGVPYNRQYLYTPGFVGGIDVPHGRWRISVYKGNDAPTVVEVELTGQNSEGDLTPTINPDTTTPTTPTNPTTPTTPSSDKFFGFDFQPIAASPQPPVIATTYPWGATRIARTETGRIRVDRDLSAGGAITGVYELLNGVWTPNRVNSHDKGRQIVLGFWSGPKPFNPEPTSLYEKPGDGHDFSRGSWNPNEAGNWVNEGSPILAYGYDPVTQTHYIKSKAINFMTKVYVTGLVIERWQRAVGENVVRTWFRVRWDRANEPNPVLLRWEAMGLEMPTLYANLATVHKGVYAGANGQLVYSDQRAGRNLTSATCTSEPWMGAVDDQDRGIGITGPDQWFPQVDLHGSEGSSYAQASETSGISLYLTNVLDYNMNGTGSMHFMFDVVVGTVAEIRQAAKLHPASNPANNAPDYDFRGGRHHGCRAFNGYVSDEGTGSALVVDLQKNNVEIKGPNTLFRAQDVPILYLKIKNESSTNRLKLGWRRPGQNDGMVAPEVDVDVPRDGEYHTRALALSSNPDWSGNISVLKIRLDIDNENNVQGQGLRLSLAYWGKTNPDSLPPTTDNIPEDPSNYVVIGMESDDPDVLDLEAYDIDGEYYSMRNKRNPTGAYPNMRYLKDTRGPFVPTLNGRYLIGYPYVIQWWAQEVWRAGDPAGDTVRHAQQVFGIRKPITS